MNIYTSSIEADTLSTRLAGRCAGGAFLFWSGQAESYVALLFTQADRASNKVRPFAPDPDRFFP